MLPSEIPLFPLPNVVLFPNVFLPLHIFEPRYRAMVADALREDRLIGMVLLQPGWEAADLDRPPVYPIGCAGLITHVETLDDGRYNIVLRGLEKFRIIEELDAEPTTAGFRPYNVRLKPDTTESVGRPSLYRRARIERIDETLPDAARDLMRQGRSRLEALLAAETPRIGGSTIADEDLVNALAQYLDLEPVEKQALLEREGLPARCAALIDLLEIKMIWARHRVSAGRSH